MKKARPKNASHKMAVSGHPACGIIIYHECNLREYWMMHFMFVHMLVSIGILAEYKNIIHLAGTLVR